MTRDEAIAKVEEVQRYRKIPEFFVDACIALGILKVEEPKTATERALQAINSYPIFANGKHLIEVLDGVGVRLVDK